MARLYIAEPDLVVLAVDRAACAGCEPDAGAGAVAAGVSVGGVYRAGRSPKQGEKPPVLSLADAKSFPDTTSSTASRCAC